MIQPEAPSRSRLAGELHFEGKNPKVVTRTKCSICVGEYEWSTDVELDPKMALLGLLGHLKKAHTELWDLTSDDVEVVGGGRLRKVLLTQAALKRVGDRSQLFGGVQLTAGESRGSGLFDWLRRLLGR